MNTEKSNLGSQQNTPDEAPVASHTSAALTRINATGDATGNGTLTTK
jgi:hypothetical protein